MGITHVDGYGALRASVSVSAKKSGHGRGRDLNASVSFRRARPQFVLMGSGTARAAASLQLDKIMFADSLLKTSIFAKADNLVFSMRLQQKCSQYCTTPYTRDE